MWVDLKLYYTRISWNECSWIWIELGTSLVELKNKRWWHTEKSQRCHSNSEVWLFSPPPNLSFPTVASVNICSCLPALLAGPGLWSFWVHAQYYTVFGTKWLQEGKYLRAGPRFTELQTTHTQRACCTETAFKQCIYQKQTSSIFFIFFYHVVHKFTHLYQYTCIFYNRLLNCMIWVKGFGHSSRW